jgi:hypothetical protein
MTHAWKDTHLQRLGVDKHRLPHVVALQLAQQLLGPGLGHLVELFWLGKWAAGC